MTPAIRDGRDRLTVDANEPRPPMGSGPVERRMASPERLADIAAERVALERAAAAQATVAAVRRPTGRFPLPKDREARDAAVIDALRSTSTVKAAGEQLGVSENRIHQVLRDIRLAGAMPADLDQLIKTRAAHAASSRTGGVRLVEAQAPEAVAPATADVDLGTTASPAAGEVATPPEPTPAEGDIERPFGLNAHAIHRIGAVSHPDAVGDSQVVDKPVSEGENAPDDRGCLDQSNIGGAPMTVSRGAGSAEDTFPQTSPQESSSSWTTRAAVAAAEALAFDHEHGRLYDALKVAEERAELAGDDGIRVELRNLRRRVARHLADRSCAA